MHALAPPVSRPRKSLVLALNLFHCDARTDDRNAPQSLAMPLDGPGKALADPTLQRRFAVENNNKNESGRVGYLVLYMMGVPVGVLLLLWVVLGNNIFGPG